MTFLTSALTAKNTGYSMALSPSPTAIPKLGHSNKNTTHFVHQLSPPRSSCSALLLRLPFNHVLSSPYQTTIPFCTFRDSYSYSIFPSNRRDEIAKVPVVSPSESVGETVQSSRLIQALRLGAMFGIWYILNIYYNIFNKQVLKVFPFPATVTTTQFAIASMVIMFMWSFNLHHRPKIRRSQLAAIITLAIAHSLGSLLTNVSLGRVAVSFTHTIKALEPFFSVVLSALFLGERHSLWVVLSIVALVGGVALASMTEVSFNWIGFCSAMASNLTNQSRNVLSKKLMVKEEETLDNVNLFSVITIISFILLVPMTIFMEGLRFTPSYLQFAASRGLNVRELLLRLVLAGFCFHAYQQVSYGILQMVSPVTHSVGNCVKCVVVIVSSVIFFQTSVSLVSSIGTATALFGVFLYSRAKQMKTKPKIS